MTTPPPSTAIASRRSESGDQGAGFASGTRHHASGTSASCRMPGAFIAGVDRDLIAQVVIIIAACVGGWMVFVHPKAAELDSIERVIELHSSHAEAPHGLSDDELDRSTIERAAQRMGEIRRRVGEIELANAIGRDSSRLYATMTDLARRHGVQVQNLQPGASADAAAVPSRGASDSGTGRGARAEARHRSPDGDPTVRQIGITVEGTYERVAQFLIAIDEMAGFIRPSTLTLLPRDGQDEFLVVAQLTCDVLSFAIPEPLAAMKGGSDGRP
jgi:hypothetical protein